MNSKITCIFALCITSLLSWYFVAHAQESSITASVDISKIPITLTNQKPPTRRQRLRQKEQERKLAQEKDKKELDALVKENKSYRAAKRQLRKKRSQQPPVEQRIQEPKKHPMYQQPATAMPSLSERLAGYPLDKKPVRTTKEIHEQYLPHELPQPVTTEPAPVEVPLEAIPTPPGDLIEFHFQDANLTNLVSQIESIFGYTFITDDAVKPSKGKSLEQSKITFKTVRPLTKKEAWNLFLIFLDAAGFNIVPQADPTLFRIQAFETALKAPLPTYIDVDLNQLPDNDSLIRYLYFIKNSSIDALKPIVEGLKSPKPAGAADPIYLQENKAFIITDKAYNIRSLMKIVMEFDKVCTPQTWSFLPLRFVDATKVKELYDKYLNPQTDKTPINPLINNRRPSTTTYFAENTRIVEEPRTNSLILLGPPSAIKKLEKFITKYIDVELQQPYSPLNIYHLKYADADTVVRVMEEITKFGKDSAAGQVGGLRGENRYGKPLQFVAETATNSVVIKGDYESYLMAKSVIEQLDAPQPQVAIEMLIVALSKIDSKTLGIQLRSKGSGNGCGPNGIKFQTSGLNTGPVNSANGIVQNPEGVGVQRLLGNLLDLVTSATPGNTVLTLGSDAFGVWGIFDVLQRVSDLEVVANPFVITTNRKTATVELGETRRVITSTFVDPNATNPSSMGDLPANLVITINPQINADGMVVLNMDVQINEFSNPINATTTANLSAGDTTTRHIKTIATVADQEVLALGGIMRNRGTASKSKVPILGDVPLLGWFFKNEQKQEEVDNLLILVSSRIIEPEAIDEIEEFSNLHIADYHEYLQEMSNLYNLRDPIERTFFTAGTRTVTQRGESFIFERRAKAELERKAAINVDTTTQTTFPSKPEQKPVVLPKDIPFTQNKPVAHNNNQDSLPPLKIPKQDILQAKNRSKFSLSDTSSDPHNKVVQS